MFLLDTDVLSLTSPNSRLSGEAVEAWRRWVHENSRHIHFSVVTAMEIRFGIEDLLSRGAEGKASSLRRWLFAAEFLHGRRVVPVDGPIAHRAGEILHSAIRSGAQPSSEDALIAATAQVMGFRLISRNRRHMEPLGSTPVDPLASLP